MIIFFPLPDDHRLVRHSFEITPRQHQFLQVTYLPCTRIVDRLEPGIARPVGAALIRWTQHLHDGIVAVCIATGARKDGPVAITPDIAIGPAGLKGIMQAMRYLFV